MVAVALGTVAGDPANGLDATRTSLMVFGTLTLTGNYGTANSHGDPVDFTTLGISTDFVPKFVDIKEATAAGTAPLGYNYQYFAGTTLKNGVLNITGTGAASGDGGTELTEAAAYAAQSPSLANAVLNFRAEFIKNV
jgi:hypothetical protein